MSDTSNRENAAEFKRVADQAIDEFMNVARVPPMTLRDYFAARAPEAPDWFFPLPNPFPQVKGTVDDWNNAKRQAVVKRYFDWRWHYADMMLDGRDE